MAKQMGKIVKEFRDFAVRGNMVDLAVGIAVGTAFNKIVSSLVSDLIMPPIGLILGKVNFSNLFVSLSGRRFATLAEAQQAGAATLNYGVFIDNIINFFVVSTAIFILVKQINRLRRSQEGTPKREETDKNCPYCLTRIPFKATRCPACTSQLSS